MVFSCLYRVEANYISVFGDTRSIRLMVVIGGIDVRARRGDPLRDIRLL